MLLTLSPIVNDLKGESPIVDTATPLDCALHQSPNLLPLFPHSTHALSLQLPQNLVTLNVEFHHRMNLPNSVGVQIGSPTIRR
jgi:hypothetical protein